MSKTTILYDTCKALEKRLHDELLSSIRSLVNKHDNHKIIFNDSDTWIVIGNYAIGGIHEDILLHADGYSKLFSIEVITQHDLFRVLYLIELNY